MDTTLGGGRLIAPLLSRAGRVPVTAVRSGGPSGAAAGAATARSVASAALAAAATVTAAASAVSVGMAQPGRCSSCGSGLVCGLLSGDACCCTCKLGNSQLVHGQVLYDRCPLSRCQLLVSHVTLKLWVIRSGYDIMTVVHLCQFGCHRTDAKKSRPGGGGGGARFGMMNPEG